MAKPQKGQAFWTGHSTVSRSGRSRGEVLAICVSVTLFCGVSIMFDEDIVNIAHVLVNRSVS